MRRHLWAFVGVGLLCLAVGLVLPLSRPDDFGWFADVCPGFVTGITYTTGAFVLSDRQVIGCLIGILGLVVIAGGVSFRLGQRRGPSATPQPVER